VTEENGLIPPSSYQRKAVSTAELRERTTVPGEFK